MEPPFECPTAGVSPIPSTANHQSPVPLTYSLPETRSPLDQPLPVAGLLGEGRRCISPSDAVFVDELGKGGAARNRWPQAETAALLRIRSEMDSHFRDSNLKGPVWEEVSRKLAEFGYQRDAKKCKEKFENIYKYYRRTKEGRAGRQDGRNYRFFNELEALGAKSVDNHIDQGLFVNIDRFENERPCVISTEDADYSCYPTIEWNDLSFENLDILTNYDLSDLSDSDCDDPEYKKNYRPRKSLFILFENFMKQVMAKQDAMHDRFLEMLEKRENDVLLREETWRGEERARIEKEREAIAHERSLLDSRYRTIISSIQKTFGSDIKLPNFEPSMIHQFVNTSSDLEESHESKGLTSVTGGRRWPCCEVHALIELRKGKGLKLQDMGPKSGLWDEIAAGMASLGYNRSAKRCKEKWENINKYFRKAKGNSRKRPRSSKTCPYFDELEIFHQKDMLISITTPVNEANMVSDEEILEKGSGN